MPDYTLTDETLMPETPKDEPVKARFCGKPGRSGAASGNANAMRHGLKAGKLPAGCQYIENRCNALRRGIESTLAESKGQIGIVDAATVNSVLKWERHGLLAQHWLRKEVDSLSVSERLKFSEAIAKASDNRDRALRSLGLDRDRNESVIDALYSRVVPDSADAASNLEDK